MVKIHYRVVIVGIFCLTIMFVSLLIYTQEQTVLQSLIVGMVGLCVGVIVPTPKVDNRKGWFIW